ncbi:hypothetical protein [Rhizobium sp. CNPSo 3490]|uniref:hypothetical protein n=1 Tax=Rhizobium sp. CNPSo 3490 TaxID=3021407 RepID=UPI0025517D75|nr:hypothetical protein [Rhizobium sp. CNPSo 3490]MDK4736232.1 hypothetical protein [Rhizobium sp. CNPSo 3490]
MSGEWSRRSDDEVFGDASEQPGSQMSYWRDTEIRRRLYILEQQNLELQKQLLEATISGTNEQRAAIAEMKRQSKLMLASVIAAFLAALFTLVAAFAK